MSQSPKEPPSSPAPDFSTMLQEVEEENDFDKIFERFLDPANVAHLTDLNGEEILAFTTLKNFALDRKLVPLQNWLMENLQLRVSKSRQGRKEFVRMAQRSSDYNEQQRRPFFDFRRE